MGRPAIDPKRKIAEGKFLAERINSATDKYGKGLTRETLGAELGVTQGLVSQWIVGATNIPDKTLLKLGGRLDFDPIKLRPSLSDYGAKVIKELGSEGIRSPKIERIAEILSKCDDGQYRQALAVLDALLQSEDQPPQDTPKTD